MNVCNYTRINQNKNFKGKGRSRRASFPFSSDFFISPSDYFIGFKSGAKCTRDGKELSVVEVG